MARSKSRTAQQNQAISDKIQLLVQEGFPENQATAIAFRMYRDGELDIPKESRVINGIQSKSKSKNLLNQMLLAFELLGLANQFNQKPRN